MGGVTYTEADIDFGKPMVIDHGAGHEMVGSAVIGEKLRTIDVYQVGPLDEANMRQGIVDWFNAQARSLPVNPK